MNVRLYLAQRISAAVMAPLVLIHLLLIVYAIKGGLTAADILGRTRGSLVWGLLYETFVIAAAVHGAIGARTVAHEWAGLNGLALDVLAWLFGALLLVLGSRAVFAVVLA